MTTILFPLLSPSVISSSAFPTDRITRNKAKPVGSPPARVPSSRLLLLIGQFTGLPARSAVLAFLVVHRHLLDVTRTQFCGLGLDWAHKIGCHNNVPCENEKETSGRLPTAIVLPSLKI